MKLYKLSGLIALLLISFSCVNPDEQFEIKATPDEEQSFAFWATAHKVTVLRRSNSAGGRSQFANK